MDDKFTIGLIVSNKYGVLNRVAGLYAKRGFNIDSLAVGTTEDTAFSRITIVSRGDAEIQDQVIKQLQKLHDVKKVLLFDSSHMISVEHLLIKLGTENGNNTRASSLVNRYGGKIKDFGENFLTAEITGDSGSIDNFIDACSEFDILELCRSGAISMALGTDSMLSIKEFKIN